MPKKETTERAKKARREGKSPSTQAGEFVHEEIESIRKGEHGAKSAKQAIAIGLSKARRAGVDVPPPEKGKASEETRSKAKKDSEAGKRATKKAPSRKRAAASKKALQREGSAAASKTALSRQAKKAASKRSASDRSAAAKKAARTKGAAGRSAAAKKAARTRARKAG